MSLNMSLSTLTMEADPSKTADAGPKTRPAASHRLRPLFPGLLPAALALALLIPAGCQQPQRQTPQVVPTEHTTTLEGLAVRLGLRIEEREEAFVVLKNAANTVLIFTHADGRYFVNGTPIGPVGAVKKAGGTVYVSDLLVPQIRAHLRAAVPQPAAPRPAPPRARGLVVVDAGHGGNDPGTISAGGLHEKDINLQVALRVATLLERNGVGVVLTRRDDRYPELEERADIANRRSTDLFVSIHADSNPDRSRRGFTLFVARSASPQARQAAEGIEHAMAATGCDSHGIREADYKVLVNTDCPAVLVELGHLSNTQDAARLRDPAWQNRLAQAIVSGILDYLR
jgi:N-acetylmuramoyl-L-alanine amidase